MDVLELVIKEAIEVSLNLRTSLERISKVYWHLDSYSDAKLKGWPLMSNPLGVLTILALYFTFVYHGWRYAHRQSRAKARLLINETVLNTGMFIYNWSMTILNGWIAYELYYCGVQANYRFLCQLVYPGVDNVYETRIARALWWYFISKNFELLDTVFIIVRQKGLQLSFLHIYHHSTMCLVWWVGAKFVPGGSALNVAFVNCVVHVLMYAYYAFATLGPRVRAYLWWKKYLTILQLVQFVAGVTLGLNSIFSGCAFTRWMQYVWVAYAFSFLVLFGKFYWITYSCQRRPQATKRLPRKRLAQQDKRKKRKM